MPVIPMANKAKNKLAANELVLCMAVSQMRTPDVAMMAATCGFDAIFIEMEHGPMDLESASRIAVAALGFGVTPIARIASHHAHDMARFLDSGGQGLMVPHIETAAEARNIVTFCKFPPKGHRSAPGTVPTLAYESPPQSEINRILDDQVLLIAMLETPKGIDNCEAIAAVDGIDMVHIGALDTSNEMGIGGELEHARMKAAYERVAAACKANGKAMGIGGARNNEPFQKYLIGIGVRYLTIGSDFGYMMAAARADAAKVRALAP